MKPAKESEKDVEKCVRTMAAEDGGIAMKFTSPQRRSAPDEIVILPGNRIFFVECKSEGEDATPAQKREHERLRRRGAFVYVCDTQRSVRDAFDDFKYHHPGVG